MASCLISKSNTLVKIAFFFENQNIAFALKLSINIKHLK